MTTVKTAAANWLPLEGELKARALQVLNEIKVRYKDPEKVRSLMKQVPKQEVDGIKIDRWSDETIGSGFTGICLLLAQLDQLFPDEEWDLVGHQYLQQVQQVLEQDGVNRLSLYSGLAGILVSIRALSRGGTRYQGMVNAIAEWFEQLMLQNIQMCKQEWEAGRVQMSQYDTIEGFAGMGRVAMLFPERPQMKLVLDQMIDLFHVLCGDKDLNGSNMPRWHIEAQYQFQDREKKQYPNGNFNLGLSHGITGPLSFLSLSALHGVTDDLLVSNISKLADWVCKWQVNSERGAVWPGRVTFEEFMQNELQSNSTNDHRDSWCYGVPGIARSIWLAGKAVQNEEWVSLGLNAYLGIEKRIETNGGLTSATLCHGVSGLLHLIQRMYSDTGHESLGKMRDDLTRKVLDMYVPESLFGYYDHNFIDGKLQEVDEAGFLTGTAGVAVVLASLIGDESPDWDLVLLIQ
ncbi:lanthionine synthetase C family protein [Paenibacillus sp. 481]|uniref:lanthionine synthetase C family protein n=1 Tax=Paenibacillus sp. 481 TaxID=2835869 RepID=UPI001E323B2E|nr:lanthionine synthetase C family protein [Paenibacillus sp. 481]UHA73643.1 lanthionine synthetase C family protein [Paenibacillus sp. 481]